MRNKTFGKMYHLYEFNANPASHVWPMQFQNPNFRPLGTFPGHCLNGTALRNINRIDDLPSTNELVRMWCEHQHLISNTCVQEQKAIHAHSSKHLRCIRKTVEIIKPLQGVTVTFHYTYSYLDFHSQNPQKKKR